jgi:hypothetical protein
MIIFTHHTGEPHGLLGPQVAATFLHRRLSIPSIVVGIQRSFSAERLLSFVEEHYAGQERLAAFSHLCGRQDLFDLAGELRQRGFTTILAGPQAREDYIGEPQSDAYPHRFHGLKGLIDTAFQGPVDHLRMEHLAASGKTFGYPWTSRLFLEVDWSNLYTFSDTLNRIDVGLGQVLNAVGCPYAGASRRVKLPPPTVLKDKGIPDLAVRSEGCVFCDVARDKGYHGSVDRTALLAQIANLPQVDGRRIPFELIDEYPIRSLESILNDAGTQGIELSQINLVCRVDDINTHAPHLKGILSLARNRDVRIFFASIGFESFSDRLLQHFSKGITVAEIIRCVETLRRLKDEFRDHLLYRRDEGANHGFIRPTPWDDGDTLRETDQTIFLNRLFDDILPDKSIPLIIHHASYLGDWIRQLESRSGIVFPREGTWIEWWNPLTRQGPVHKR